MALLDEIRQRNGQAPAKGKAEASTVLAARSKADARLAMSFRKLPELPSSAAAAAAMKQGKPEKVGELLVGLGWLVCWGAGCWVEHTPALLLLLPAAAAVCFVHLQHALHIHTACDYHPREALPQQCPISITAQGFNSPLPPPHAGDCVQPVDRHAGPAGDPPEEGALRVQAAGRLHDHRPEGEGHHGL
jgi:hypothetical protein